jgi:RNA polymerase sigma-70 factor (ECF subfamily)
LVHLSRTGIDRRESGGKDSAAADVECVVTRGIRSDVAEQPSLPTSRADRAEFTALVRRCDDRLRGLAYKLLAGDAHRMDDVLQDAYLRAFARFGTFRGEAEASSWLYRIAYNACIDELRWRQRQPVPMDVVGWEHGRVVPGPDDAVGAADATVRALAALPLDQRATLVLVDGEGFDYRSAAELLGVAPGTVASRLSRARATMRRLIEEGTP